MNVNESLEQIIDWYEDHMKTRQDELASDVASVSTNAPSVDHRKVQEYRARCEAKRKAEMAAAMAARNPLASHLPGGRGNLFPPTSSLFNNVSPTLIGNPKLHAGNLGDIGVLDDVNTPSVNEENFIQLLGEDYDPPPRIANYRSAFTITVPTFDGDPIDYCEWSWYTMRRWPLERK